jgi:tetratricopeptide (TPR) repeat protein
VDVLAKTYLAQGQFDKGLALVRAQAAKYPKSAPSQQLLGIWLQNNRQFAEARTAYAAAKSADPSYDDADLALGLLSMREQKLDEASKLFSGVLERKPFNTRARAFLALANEMTGAYPSAIENYRELVAQEPDNPLFLNGLAWDLAEHAQKPDEALALAEKAKGLAPNDPRVADTLGWIYYQKGIYKSAISQLESASSPAGRLAGEDLDRVKYHLAMAYFKAGDAPRGQAVLTATLRSAPNLPEAKLAAQIRDQVRDVH